MMSNSQAQKGKVKPCPNGCGKDIYFESRFGEDGKLIMKESDPSKPRWWMMEDVSKQSHQCPNNRFKNVAVEKTQDLIQKDLLQPQSAFVTQPLSVPQARSMDVADFAEEPMRVRVQLECKFIKIIEDEVIKFLTYYDDRTRETVTPNPNHVGMYVKLIKDCMENKN